MTAKLEKILSDIDKLLNNLSKEDLKVVQEHVSEKLGLEDASSDSSSLIDNKPEPHLRIGHPLSPKVIDSILAVFLTPEELAKVGGIKLLVNFELYQKQLPNTLTRTVRIEFDGVFVFRYKRFS